MVIQYSPSIQQHQIVFHGNPYETEFSIFVRLLDTLEYDDNHVSIEPCSVEKKGQITFAAPMGSRASFCVIERSSCWQKKAELSNYTNSIFLSFFFSELQKEEVQVRKPFWYFLYLHHHFVLRHTLHNSLWGIVLFPDGNVHHLCFTVICAQSWDEYLIFS